MKQREIENHISDLDNKMHGVGNDRESTGEGDVWVWVMEEKHLTDGICVTIHGKISQIRYESYCM